MVMTRHSQAVEPPIELLRSRPRDVRLTAAGVFLSAIGVLLLAGSVVVTVFLAREAAGQARRQQQLETSGVVTTAHVLRLWRETNDSKTPRVEYTYEANGRDFIGRAKLPLRRWQSLRGGDALDVKYVSSAPEQHVVVHAEPEVLPAWLPATIGVVTAAVGVLCGLVVQAQRRLLSEGRITRATVTKVTKRHTSHGGSYRSVAFTFSTLSGATVAGKSSTSRKAADIGSPIWVVYDPENPKRSAVYPLQLVTLPR